jgi:N-acylneuraminate cytidylyltransferase
VQCLAVIPARGGSKGVPRKNLRLLGGVPLVAHAIRAARGARRVTRVLVSTDDPEIARVATEYGAEVIARPSELSGDTASSESAVLHALDVLRVREGYEPELVMLVQCTSPLTRAADLDGLVERLLEAGADSAFTAVPFFHFLWRIDHEGYAVGVNHAGNKRKRRQDLAPEFLESGAAYVARTPAFREAADRFAGRVVVHVTPGRDCLEIDEPADLDKAEALLRRARDGQRWSSLPERVQAVIFDFDGVLTDNRVQVDERGVESVTCDRGDGLGLGLLRAAGVQILILSKERSRVVQARADKLGLECLQGVDDKLPALRGWLSRHGIELSASVYVGNDVNDLDCMRAVACAVAPSDAHPAALSSAQLVLARPGGRGAVRELCDLLCEHLRGIDAAR